MKQPMSLKNRISFYIKLVIYSFIYALALSCAGCGVLTPKTVYVEKVVTRVMDIPPELLTPGVIPAPPVFDAYIKLDYPAKEDELRVYINKLLSYSEENNIRFIKLKELISKQKALLEEVKKE